MKAAASPALQSRSAPASTHSSQPPAGPVNPQPLLDEPSFDGKNPEGKKK